MVIRLYVGDLHALGWGEGPQVYVTKNKVTRMGVGAWKRLPLKRYGKTELGSTDKVAIIISFELVIKNLDHFCALNIIQGALLNGLPYSKPDRKNRSKFEIYLKFVSFANKNMLCYIFEEPHKVCSLRHNIFSCCVFAKWLLRLHVISSKN